MSISKNSLFVFNSQLVMLAVGILISVVVSRILGPTDRGAYFLSITVSYMIVSFGNFGVSFTNIYLLSKGERTLNEVNSASTILAIFIGFLFIGLYIIFHDFLHMHLLKGVRPVYIAVAVLISPLVLYGRFWETMMSGLNKFELLSKFNIVSVVIEAISTLIVLLVLKLGIHGLVGWWVVSAFMFTLAKIYILNRQERLVFSFDLKLLKEILYFGFKGHIGDIAWTLDNRLGIFIVNYFTGVTGVGHFSLSVSLAEKIWFLPTPLKTASNPIIGGSEKHRAGMLTARVNRHILLLSVILAVLIAMVAPWGIPFFYGDEYAPSVIPLLILLPGVVLARSIFSSYIILQLGKPNIPSIVTWINTIIHIPLAFILIKIYGLIGAALSLSIFYILQFVFLLMIFKTKSNVPLSEILIPRASDIGEYKQLLLKGYQRFIFLAKNNLFRAKSSVNTRVTRS